MNKINELLREADPTKLEPALSPAERDSLRLAIMAAAHDSATVAPRTVRWWLATAAPIALTLVLGSLLVFRVWAPLVSDVEAAVRFEIRLAEDKPGLGLRETRVAASERTIYVHNETIVRNNDIAAAEVVSGGGPSQFAIDVKFNSAGSDKMVAATRNHIGKPLAILIDGKVVMAPTLRAVIERSAVVTGDFTRPEADRIARGMRMR